MTMFGMQNIEQFPQDVSHRIVTRDFDVVFVKITTSIDGELLMRWHMPEISVDGLYDRAGISVHAQPMFAVKNCGVNGGTPWICKQFEIDERAWLEEGIIVDKDFMKEC